MFSVPDIPGLRNTLPISIAALVMAGCVIFDFFRTKKAQAALPVDVEAPESYPLGRNALLLLFIIATIVSYAGVLFIPADVWHDLGTGICAALGILSFIYGLQRYLSGAWRKNPRMTRSRAILGVTAMPLIAFLLFWGALVLSGGALYTAAAGHNETLETVLTKHRYHDKAGTHYCLQSPDFANGNWLHFLTELCGLDADEFNSLPPHFRAVLDVRRSGLGYTVIRYRRKN